MPELFPAIYECLKCLFSFHLVGEGRQRLKTQFISVFEVDESERPSKKPFLEEVISIDFENLFFFLGWIFI